jgi:hypothetical protein
MARKKGGKGAAKGYRVPDEKSRETTQRTGGKGKRGGKRGKKRY